MNKKVLSDETVVPTLPAIFTETKPPSTVFQAPITVDGRAEFSPSARRMVTTGKFSVCIASQELDAGTWGGLPLAESLKEFLLLHRNSSVKVLLESARGTQRGPHALVDLSRILTSRIHFRVIPENLRLEYAEQIIVDGRMMLERRRSHDLHASLQLFSPLECREHQRAFDDLWEQAVPSTELRTLGL